MKIILLDNDGVMRFGTRVRSKQFPKFSNFDKICVNVLNEVLEETNAEIVITSDWRLENSLKDLQEFYSFQGLVKKPIDKTRDLQEYDNETWKKLFSPLWDLENMRILEIKDFLYNTDLDIEKFVIIDDLFLGKSQYYKDEIKYNNPLGFEEFVHCDDKLGLSEKEIKERILKFL